MEQIRGLRMEVNKVLGEKEEVEKEMAARGIVEKAEVVGSSDLGCLKRAEERFLGENQEVQQILQEQSEIAPEKSTGSSSFQTQKFGDINK